MTHYDRKVIYLWLVALATLTYIATVSNVLTNGNHIQEILRPNCVVVLIAIKMNHQTLKPLLKGNTYVHLSEKIPALVQMQIRKLDKCFDIVMNMGKMYRDGHMPIKTRSARYIYILDMPLLQNNETMYDDMQEYWYMQDNHLEEAVLILQETNNSQIKRHRASLWLSCPYYDQERNQRPVVRLINHRNSFRWSYNIMEFQKPYNLCNPGKSFYFEKHFVYMGAYGHATLKLQEHLLKVMTSHFGTASVKFKIPSSIYIFGPNWELIPNSTLGQVVSGQADINGAIYWDEISNVYGDFAIYNEEFYFYATRRPRKLPPTMNMLYAFDFITWLFLLASLASVTCMLLVLGKAKKRSLLNITFIPYGITFGENHFKEFNYKSKTTYAGITIRYSWLVCIFVLTVAYQGNLKACLTVAEFEPIVDNYRALIKKDLPIYGKNIIEFAQYAESGTFQADVYQNALKHNSSLSPYQYPGVLKQLMEGSPGFIDLCTCDNYAYREMYYMHDENMASISPLVVAIRSPLNLNFPFTLKKYLTQAEEIMDLVQRIVEVGIVKALISKVKFSTPSAELQHDNKQSLNSSEILDLGHIVLITMVLLMGLAISTLVFVVEWSHRTVLSFTINLLSRLWSTLKAWIVWIRHYFKRHLYQA